MLESLRGQPHQVHSGVAVVDSATGARRLDSHVTQVVMRDYSPEEVDAYIASGSPMDKAGAYGVQDTDFHPVSAVRGCYTNVVGLPLCALTKMLQDLGSRDIPPVPAHLVEGCTDCPLREGAGP